jgi:hypothetical protein
MKTGDLGPPFCKAAAPGWPSSLDEIGDRRAELDVGVVKQHRVLIRRMFTAISNVPATAITSDNGC